MDTFFSQLSSLSLLSITVRLLLTTVFAGTLGYERERHRQAAGFIRPAHQAGEIAGEIRLNRGQRFAIHLAGGTIQRNIISFVEGMSAQLKYFVILIDRNIAAA